MCVCVCVFCKPWTTWVVSVSSSHSSETLLLTCVHSYLCLQSKRYTEEFLTAFLDVSKNLNRHNSKQVIWYFTPSQPQQQKAQHSLCLASAERLWNCLFRRGHGDVHLVWRLWYGDSGLHRRVNFEFVLSIIKQSDINHLLALAEHVHSLPLRVMSFGM